MATFGTMSEGKEFLTPPQIFRLFEAGSIDREELHRLMGELHQRCFREIEEHGSNPILTRFYGLLNRRAAWRLVRRHGARAIREVMLALAEIPGFPPAFQFWNARHVDVPLHCLIRERPEPVARILEMDVQLSRVDVTVHYGALRGKGAVRESFVFRRSRHGVLELARRGGETNGLDA